MLPDGVVLKGTTQYDGFDVGEALPAPVAGAWTVAALKCMGTSSVNDSEVLKRWPDFADRLTAICELRTT